MFILDFALRVHTPLNRQCCFSGKISVFEHLLFLSTVFIVSLTHSNASFTNQPTTNGACYIKSIRTVTMVTCSLTYIEQ